MTKAKTKRMDLEFAALMSEDDDAVLTALDRIEKEGDAQAIRPLVTALRTTDRDNVRQRIVGLLYTVKAKDAVNEMLAVIADPSFSRERVILISAIWNAGLDVREHLPVFIDIALEGTAEECFECITVIENQEIWPEKACRSALVQLKKALPEVTDNYRSAMLSDLMKVLEYRLGVGEN